MDSHWYLLAWCVLDLFSNGQLANCVSWCSCWVYDCSNTWQCLPSMEDQSNFVAQAHLQLCCAQLPVHFNHAKIWPCICRQHGASSACLEMRRIEVKWICLHVCASRGGNTGLRVTWEHCFSLCSWSKNCTLRFHHAAWCRPACLARSKINTHQQTDMLALCSRSAQAEKRQGQTW